MPAPPTTFNLLLLLLLITDHSVKCLTVIAVYDMLTRISINSKIIINKKWEIRQWRIFW